jgi:hypothetical protein
VLWVCRSSDSVARRFAEASPTPGLVFAASRRASLIENGSAALGPLMAKTRPVTAKYIDFICTIRFKKRPGYPLQKKAGQANGAHPNNLEPIHL